MTLSLAHVRRFPFIPCAAATLLAAASMAQTLAAQEPALVLRGRGAQGGSPCMDADVPITGPDMERRADVAPSTLPRAQADSTTGAKGDSTVRRPVTIALLASAEAREVRFARQPRIRVRLCGGLDSVRVVERRNLPRPVVAGQTYRDVYIAVEILGRLNAECLAARVGARDSTAGGQPAAHCP